MHSALRFLKDWGNAAMALVYPEVCQLCSTRRATPAEGFVCETCAGETSWIREPLCHRCGRPFQGQVTQAFECTNCRATELFFTSARSAVAAEGKVLDVIHRYKYNRSLWFEPFLARLLVVKAAPVLRGTDWTAIVPVPLHPRKQREREFNQAERLSRHLGAAIGVEVQTRWLKRVADTETQTHLTRKERVANVENAFGSPSETRLGGARIILVDDVMTTGATTNACARVLRQSGASEVCVWTVARGI
jgi:ComF family protein